MTCVEGLLRRVDDFINRDISDDDFDLYLRDQCRINCSTTVLRS